MVQGGIMSMNKQFFVLGFLLLFFCFVLASTSVNTIQHFGLSWNPNSNQISISSQCKGQAIAQLVLSTGQSREIICSAVDVGGSWMIGEQENVEQITGTLTIQSPCDVCSRTSTISLSDPSAQTPFFSAQLLFGIGLVIVVLLLLFVLNWLKG